MQQRGCAIRGVKKLRTLLQFGPDGEGAPSVHDGAPSLENHKDAAERDPDPAIAVSGLGDQSSDYASMVEALWVDEVPEYWLFGSDDEALTALRVHNGTDSDWTRDGGAE